MIRALFGLRLMILFFFLSVSRFLKYNRCETLRVLLALSAFSMFKAQALISSVPSRHHEQPTEQLAERSESRGLHLSSFTSYLF